MPLSDDEEDKDVAAHRAITWTLFNNVKRMVNCSAVIVSSDETILRIGHKDGVAFIQPIVCGNKSSQDNEVAIQQVSRLPPVMSGALLDLLTKFVFDNKQDLANNDSDSHGYDGNDDQRIPVSASLPLHSDPDVLLIDRIAINVRRLQNVMNPTNEAFIHTEIVMQWPTFPVAPNGLKRMNILILILSSEAIA
ncbi:hypothetical protein BC830DRAFT_1083965 [Chytriomyces sp. MP71]|nr:hypothetical protein BC830DRAFT_1083965 [Chytriomyces sp. MP71]